MKVATIVGTRPELIKLSEVIKTLERHVEHVLIHTGQNYDYELYGTFMGEFGISAPDQYLDVAGGSPGEAVANVISRAYDCLYRLQPDAVLIYGDTNSCMAAYSAKRLKIPVFHMEAGNRCFDERVPEEINRRIIDHISDINMTITEHARRNLIAEGVPQDRVFCIGSNMPEVIIKNSENISSSKIIEDLGLVKGEYFLVSCHREENIDARALDFIDCVNAMADKYDVPIIVSTHPRTRKTIDINNLKVSDKVKLCKPFGYSDYIALQTNSKCVVSDSGTITEEAAILKFKAVTIRQAHERPEGSDVGVLIMSDLNVSDLLYKLDVAMQLDNSIIPGDYSYDDVSSRVLKIILSYTDYVNRTVWRKTDG